MGIQFILKGNVIVTKLKTRISRLRPYRSVTRTREEWEKKYLTGGYDRLWEIGELSRYSIILGYCRHLKPEAAILDIGCGDGILCDSLSVINYKRYVGIDISREAIRQASLRQNERACFIEAEAGNFIPESQFDIIIFNECLYYFKDPLSIVKRYERYLKKGGYFIISMAFSETKIKVWNFLESHYQIMDMVHVSNKSNISWYVKVIQPDS